MLVRLFLSVLLVMSSAFLGCDQLGTTSQTGSISGVVSQGGIGVEGVTVELSGDAQKNVTTGNDGSYSFTSLQPGTYSVSPSKEFGTASPDGIEVLIEEDNLKATGVDFDIDIEVENPNPACKERVWKGDYVALTTLGVQLLSGITTVTGNLTITSTTWPDLGGLECLQHVGGNLTLSGNALASLEGLNNLTTVGGSLTILGNALIDLTGIRNLQSVGGHLTLSGTTALSFKGLENLDTIDGNLTIVANPVLLDIKSLSNLTGVKDLYITANPCLLSLEGLNGIRSSGNVGIVANPAITSLKGLENLEIVEGFLSERRQNK
ncbi:MAG: carboxypeptidase regulatory-like domain-containing protein [Proteobacteria bacterium]|nr:carboxypeptidase regulatory-like domain-containing protein [Pseudomonadota bacterium]